MPSLWIPSTIQLHCEVADYPSLKSCCSAFLIPWDSLPLPPIHWSLTPKSKILIYVGKMSSIGVSAASVPWCKTLGPSTKHCNTYSVLQYTFDPPMVILPLVYWAGDQQLFGMEKWSGFRFCNCQRVQWTYATKCTLVISIYKLMGSSANFWWCKQHLHLHKIK